MELLPGLKKGGITIISHHILVINTGIQSLKIAVFKDDKLVFNKTIRDNLILTIDDETRRQKQLTVMKQRLLLQLKQAGIEMKKIDLVISNTGYLKPLSSGVYTINAAMVADLIANASYTVEGSFGAILAQSLSAYYHIPAVTYDPPTVDELQPEARISGHPQFERRSYFNALNQKAVSRQVAEKIGKSYESSRFVVAHLGSAISVGVHKDGKVVDVNNGYFGGGPFSTIRTGSLPLSGWLIEYRDALIEPKKIDKLIHEGGFSAYLGTDSLTDVEWEIAAGNQKAIAIYEAMLYQIAKEIGAYATVLKGDIDAIILTGGMTISPYLVEQLIPYIEWIAPIYTIEDQLEMKTMGEIGLRILQGTETVRDYQSSR
ncbi:butyrate kinase [Brochothrix campestris]|uniref:Probable butyrate kinase n=1 Tax=Brochothrix campestris FSL F6-1037 TaxID=1265861 RepID=W7CFR6_9LIST|nr:butyrate kinase [Brochothrix campestris]EUJ38239.1 butyrate kinase [Brochothrix campestris FSL F6-1037]